MRQERSYIMETLEKKIVVEEFLSAFILKKKKTIHRI